MHLTNEVVLPAPPDELFTLINDVERVAPCMPGATLEGGSADDAYRGKVKVKVGPLSAAYSGTVRFLEVDRGNHRLVLDARGTDQHGSGGAEAKVQVSISSHEQGSLLALDTDLVVRGKVAQFGRGALGDVSQKLMEQFARNLSGLLAESGPATESEPVAPMPRSEPVTQSGGAQSVGAQSVGAQPGVRDQSDDEVNALSLVVVPMAKRIAPVAVALAAGVVAGRLLGRNRPGSGNVIADELLTASVHIGNQRYSIPARRVTSLVPKR